MWQPFLPVYQNTTRLASFLPWYDVFACILNDFLRWEPLLHCLEGGVDWESHHLGGLLGGSRSRATAAWGRVRLRCGTITPLGLITRYYTMRQSFHVLQLSFPPSANIIPCCRAYSHTQFRSRSFRMSSKVLPLHVKYIVPGNEWSQQRSIFVLGKSIRKDIQCSITCVPTFKIVFQMPIRDRTPREIRIASCIACEISYCRIIIFELQ